MIRKDTVIFISQVHLTVLLGILTAHACCAQKRISPL